jgi:hypothetical protein
MEASSPEPAVERDWSALPAGVLQLIMHKSSTWQAPGSCLAAPVCTSWRSAAAGCKDVRLLYVSGQPQADDSFKAWVSQNSPQLAALALSSFSDNNTSVVEMLQALAEAGEAAQAAGAPLALHTLRVLHGVSTPFIEDALAGRLLACLPHLRCLQLDLVCNSDAHSPSHTLGGEVPAALGPLQQATQLQELYLNGPYSRSQAQAAAVAGLLPLALERLSWCAGPASAAPDLSHLTGVTFLHLPSGSHVTSAKLPPRLQQLELGDIRWSPGALEEQQRVLVGLRPNLGTGVQPQLGHLTNLKRLTLGRQELGRPAVRTALAQLTQLSALTIFDMGSRREDDLLAALATAGSISSLRSLTMSLDMVSMPVLPSLSVAKGVTRLVTCLPGSYSMGDTSQHHAWADEIGRMAGLQWLSVSDALLKPGWGPLAGLQQLRVLVVRCGGSPFKAQVCTNHLAAMVEGWGRSGLPPRLQVVCVHGMSAQAATEQMRRLREVLRGSGCELVVGVNLDEVCRPAQQLAGLPVDLQQVLA